MSRIFYESMFGLLLFVACLGVWELLELLFRGPAEEPAPRAHPTEPGAPEPWEELNEEDRAYLRQFFK